MFNFPYVIEDGTPDEIKDCLFATLVAMPFQPIPVVKMHIVSAPVFSEQRRIAAEWTCELDQILHSSYSTKTERQLVNTLTSMLERGMFVDEDHLAALRADLDARKAAMRVRRYSFGKSKRPA